MQETLDVYHGGEEEEQERESEEGRIQVHCLKACQKGLLCLGGCPLPRPSPSDHALAHNPLTYLILQHSR